MNQKIIKCENVGVSGTTPTHIQERPDGTFEARMGIALLGTTQMTKGEYEECGYDPFHSKFFDNYVSGTGDTEAEAIEALKQDHRKMTQALWGM